MPQPSSGARDSSRSESPSSSGKSPRAPKRILIVGHCGVDGPRLQSEVSACVAGAEVLRINSEADLERACDAGADLLLVNREPVGFEGTSGLDIIRKVCGGRPARRAMLVSDYADAQEQAVAAGAVEGFGKRDMGSPKLADTVLRALGEPHA